MPSRRAGREQALQALYSIAIGDRAASDAVTEVVGDDASDEHRAFVADLVLGTIAHTEEADEVFGPLLVGWSIERLPTIDRLVLRMGTFELRHRKQIPPAVVINEAVELAKKFSTDESGKFINGVLNTVAHEHAA